MPTRGNVTVAPSNPGASPTSFNHTVVAGNNRALYFFQLERFNNGYTVTYGGVPMTLKDTSDNGTALRVACYELLNPAVGTAAIQVTATGTIRRWVGFSVDYADVDQTTPTGVVAKATGTSTGPTVGVASSVGDEVLGACCAQNDANTITGSVGGGQTSAENDVSSNGTTNGVRGIGSYEPGASGTVTHSYTISASALWSILAFSIKTAAGGAPSNTVAPVANATPSWDVGKTATVTNGTWTNSPSSFSYQWQRDVAGNGVFSNIAGQTAQTYILAAADLDCNVRCVVTATNGSGSTSANSNAFGPITAFSRMTFNQLFDSDQQVYLTVGTDGYFDLFLRYDPGTDTGYLVEYESDSQNINIYRVDGLGVFVQISSGHLANALVSGDQVGFEADVGTLTVYLNGVPVTQTTDTTYIRPGYLGVGLGTDMVVNDFGGGEINPIPPSVVSIVTKLLDWFRRKRRRR